MKTMPMKITTPPTVDNDNLLHNPSQANSSLVKRTISQESRIEVYSNCVCYYPSPQKKGSFHRGSRPRGKISDFSKRSRFRLFQKMAQIKKNLVNKPFFLTLTYHYGYKKLNHSTKSNLNTFLVELRDYDPDVQFIWRIEYQKRGAPHYHLMVFPSINKIIANRKKYFYHVNIIWHRIADPNSNAHESFGCKSVEIDSYRKACSYVSKYLAKLPGKYLDIVEGKHWGCSTNLPTNIFCTISGTEKSDQYFIERMRAWLLEQGKGQYTEDYYFNVDRPQTIFIEAETFLKLMNVNTKYVDFSGL